MKIELNWIELKFQLKIHEMQISVEGIEKSTLLENPCFEKKFNRKKTKFERTPFHAFFTWEYG
jgi:hypothetical protein